MHTPRLGRFRQLSGPAEAVSHPHKFHMPPSAVLTLYCSISAPSSAPWSISCCVRSLLPALAARSCWSFAANPRMKMEALNKLLNPALMADMSSCISEVGARADLPPRLASDETCQIRWKRGRSHIGKGSISSPVMRMVLSPSSGAFGGQYRSLCDMSGWKARVEWRLVRLDGALKIRKTWSG